MIAQLRSFIARVRKRWAAVVITTGIGRAAAMIAVPIFAAALTDRFLHPEGTALMLLAAAACAIVAAIVALAGWHWPPRPGDLQVARFIEERAATLPGRALDDTLVSAVAAAGAGPSSRDAAFLPLVIDAAARRLEGLDPADLVERREIQSALLLGTAGVLLLLGALATAMPGAGRTLETARVRFFPGTIEVQVVPGDVRVPEGASLKIRASLRGSGRALHHLAPTLIVMSNGEQRTLRMARAGNDFEYMVHGIDRSFSYMVSAAPVRSARYTVTALAAPRVTRIDLHYAYPAFSGLKPREEQDAGDIYAPAGTRVRLTVHTDKAVAHGELALGSASVVALHTADDCTVEAQLVLTKDDSYRIRLADADGLKSLGEAEYFIRLMDDRPPDVRILRPSADQPITPLEEVPIEARADDDYGIASFELVYAVAGGPEHIVPFERVTGTNIEKIGTRLLPVEDLHVEPGDVITYYARARDVARGKPATLATSDIFFLEVKPFSEEFVAAQSQAGSGGSDPGIDSLIEAQKQIIASTWNVERRSAAGRSADDVRAIAQAQGELKARAEQQSAAGKHGGSGRAPAPQKSAAPEPERGSGDDPIAAAAAAMGKALQHLAAARTKDALTHEVAALNGLLQAQAEVRRRQVTQQANGGGGNGPNRSEQDLTALFDKELQREQKTNYENRAAVETRPDRSEKKDSALDRIRELAKRQEDLSQRQRDLAQASVSAEERRRQLEKLTREQEELRRQLEEIASRRPASSASANKSGNMQSAAQDMRSAAGELGRSDPNRAAESAQRAADQLRRLQREMENASAQPGSRGGRSPGDRDAQAEQVSKQLEQARGIRGRLQRAEEQLREAEARAAQGGRRGGDRQPQTARAEAQRGRGSAGQSRSGGESGSDAELQRLRDAYRRELQEAQDTLGRLGSGEPRSGRDMATPEEQVFSRSAPGTEAFKQDRSDWDSLRKNIDKSLEKYEAAVSNRLSGSRADDRFSAGGSDRVPEAYRRLIARYFESVAKKKP